MTTKKKIDIYYKGEFSNDFNYICSTQKSNSCKQAIEKFIAYKPIGYEHLSDNKKDYKASVDKCNW